MNQPIKISIEISKDEDNRDIIDVSTNVIPEVANYWLDQAKILILNGSFSEDTEETSND